MALQFADVKTDIAFRKIFGNEPHKEILIGFLNAVLDFQGERRIREIALKNPWQAPDLPLLKETILDIKAVDHRALYYTAQSKTPATSA
jgi:predicted transposase/invertase (TIGR01784 family)